MSELPNDSQHNETMSGLCDELKNVTKIVNGGLFTENRDGPTGLENGGYVEITPGGRSIHIGSQEEWLATLESLSNEMLSDGDWIFSYEENKTDYMTARAEDTKRTNSGLFVSHGLQCFEVLDSDMSFYGHSDGHIQYNSTDTETRIGKIAEIFDYEMGEITLEEADLQPGDIVTYYGEYTNVYIGTDSSGNKMWYDAGKGQTTNSEDEGGTYTKFTRTTNDIGLDISHIIRLKYDTTISIASEETSSSSDDESDTLFGAIGSLLRNIWISICTFFENLIFGREDATIWYNFNEGNNMTSSSSSASPGSISASGYVQYYQNDYAHVSYGSSNIANCGCGPTCFAMVATAITGTRITPEDAVWCGNTYYVWGLGTSWSYFGAAAQHFNLDCRIVETTDIDVVVQALRSRALVISSQTSGIFTSGGHFIVLSGLDNNDGIRVMDPNKNNAVNKRYNNRSFTKEEINASALHYWIFYY